MRRPQRDRRSQGALALRRETSGVAQTSAKRGGGRGARSRDIIRAGEAARPLPRLAGLVATALTALALALGPASSAAAHDYLVDTAPKADSVATEPVHEVKLTFNDVVLDLSGNGSSSLLQVTGPDGASRHFETGCPTTLDRTVTVPVELGDPGTYLVSWQIVSSDGHTVSGTYTFDYRPPAGTTAASGSDSRPACGAKAGATEDASPPAAGTDQQNKASKSQPAASDAGVIIGIAGGIVALAVIAVVIVLVLTRRKPGKGDRWHPGDS